jgi:hypothetical protein
LVTEIQSMMPAPKQRAGPAPIAADAAPVFSEPSLLQLTPAAVPPLSDETPAQLPALSAAKSPSLEPGVLAEPQTVIVKELAAAAPETAAPNSRVEHTISRERVIEAAIRWIAAAPPETQEEPRRNVEVKAAPPYVRGQPEAEPVPAPAAAVSEPLHQPTSEPAPMAAAEGPRPAPTKAIPIHPIPQAALLLPTRAMPQIAEERVEVSIGAIHLRIEAPAPAAVQTVPIPRLAASVPAKPHSGLSRRALRRI